MPLPVERSQGSVSALVARFSTAARRDEEAAQKERQARESLGSRRASAANTSGITARTASGSVPNNASASDGTGVNRDDASGGTDTTPESGKVNGHGPAETVKAVVKEASEGIKELVVGDDKRASGRPDDKAGPAKNGTAGLTSKQSVGSPRSVPLPRSPINAKSTGIGESSKPKHNGNGEAASSPVSAARGPRKSSTVRPSVSLGSTAKAQSTPVKAAAISSPKTTTAVRSPQVPRPSTSTTKAGGPARISPKTATLARSNSTRGISASTPGAKSGAPVRPADTKPLTPSMTGPARPRSSFNGTGDAQPLRPQMTGTPSKPTASSLAKARSSNPTTPGAQASSYFSPSVDSNGHKQTMSLGRASGSRLTSAKPKTPSSGGGPELRREAQTSPSPASGSASVSAKPAATQSDTSGQRHERRISTSTSSSRLLQGTAASRARAAAAPASAHASPAPASASKSAASTAVKTGKTPFRATTIGKSHSRTPSRAPLKPDAALPTKPDTSGAPEADSQPATGTGADGQHEQAVSSSGITASEETTPAVGFNPIGRLGLAGAREAPGHSTELKTNPPADSANKPALPAPRVIATPDGPVDEAAAAPDTDTGSKVESAESQPDDMAAQHHTEDAGTAEGAEARTEREPTAEAAPSRADSEWDMLNSQDLADKATESKGQ